MPEANDYGKAWAAYVSTLLFLLCAGLVVAAIVMAAKSAPLIAILLALLALVPLISAGIILVCFAIFRAK